MPQCRKSTCLAAPSSCWGQKHEEIERSTTHLIPLLSTEDIARSGDGETSPARWAGLPDLPLWGDGFVYVRGLGDRYSLALLNGSPLPSPEPLRRAVPRNLFPTDVIASSLVQKTYSPNFSGEFGGGVINLIYALHPSGLPQRQHRCQWRLRDTRPAGVQLLRQRYRLDRLWQPRSSARIEIVFQQPGTSECRNRRLRRDRPRTGHAG